MRRIRVWPPVYLAAAMAVMLVLNRVFPIVRFYSGLWRWSALVFVGGGIGLGVWAAVLFRKHQTTLKPGEVSSRLVMEGPFGFSRNPIYVGMVLLLVGMAICLGSLSPWVMVPIFVGVIGRNVISVEEAMLEEKFGSEYLQYRAKVRRWV